VAAKTLDDVAVSGLRVLVRADLNVPVQNGKISDLTRIERLAPTIRELSDKGAKVIVCSHFDRPKGKPDPALSLRPMAAALAEVLHKPVAFAEDCIGPVADQAVQKLASGDILVLENTRFHAGEETNDATLAASLASLADIFVNDAFSAAHRAHASTEGVAQNLPSYAGRLMQAELTALEAAPAAKSPPNSSSSITSSPRWTSSSSAAPWPTLFWAPRESTWANRCKKKTFIPPPWKSSPPPKPKTAKFFCPSTSS
jgi:phosphoglycerate kinase